MHESELREALKGLGMSKESWRALPLLPLVAVAWADGEIQDSERQLILRIANDFGLDDDGRLHLQNWLTFPPSADTVRTGQTVLLSLCSSKGPADPQLLDDVISFSHQVAAAAGGFFGIGAISSEEAQAIDRIGEALGVDPESAWVRSYDTTYFPADADEGSEGPAVEVAYVDVPSAVSRANLIHLDQGGEHVGPVIGDGLVIGRGDDVHVQVRYDPQVSRRHCRVYESERRFYIEDLESTGGTTVNGQRVVARRLLGGEEITLGAVSFFFQLLD
jgi:tellurite resistance protein